MQRDCDQNRQEPKKIPVEDLFALGDQTVQQIYQEGEDQHGKDLGTDGRKACTGK